MPVSGSEKVMCRGRILRARKGPKLLNRVGQFLEKIVSEPPEIGTKTRQVGLCANFEAQY